MRQRQFGVGGARHKGKLSLEVVPETIFVIYKPEDSIAVIQSRAAAVVKAACEVKKCQPRVLGARAERGKPWFALICAQENCPMMERPQPPTAA